MVMLKHRHFVQKGICPFCQKNLTRLDRHLVWYDSRKYQRICNNEYRKRRKLGFRCTYIRGLV